MSYTERNKGKLIFVATKPYVLDSQFDDLFPDYFEIGDNLYRVEFEVEGEECYGFSEVTINPDKSIDFHTLHYNGGGFWLEVIENKIKKMESK